MTRNQELEKRDLSFTLVVAPVRTRQCPPGHPLTPVRTGFNYAMYQSINIDIADQWYMLVCICVPGMHSAKAQHT
jgi:hypothetical protein